MATLASGDGILVIAADDQVARRFVNLITAPSENAVSLTIVPWRISNKYYDANVHFSISVMNLDDGVDDGLTTPARSSSSRDIGGQGMCPAVIYAFERERAAAAKTYRTHFLRFTELHSAPGMIDDAEVCIAACLPKPKLLLLEDDETSEDDLEDEETLDGFFSQNRFEYINVEETTNGTAAQSSSSNDATGINRIKEALHAIMWPSLVRKKPLAKSRSMMPVVFNDDSIDGGEGLSLNVDDITEDIAWSLFTPPDGSLRENELASLEAWLDQDPPDDAWKEPQNGSTQENHGSGLTQLQWFDDDFSDFISAAATTTTTTTTQQGQLSNASSNDTTTQEGSLAFKHPGDDDPFIPSNTDIAAASSRIFEQKTIGGSGSGLGSGAEAFDLNQVLSTLEVMREEISLIEDIDKKRRAAAAAALGLVSGLGLDGGVGEDDNGSELGELLTI